MKPKTLITILLLLYAVIAFCRNKVPHEFSSSECTICHTTDSNDSKISGSVTNKCMTCHTDLFDNGFMHPVDMRPKKISIPLDLPLDENGLMTCNTCHDVHSNHETPRGKESHFLRRLERGKAFCNSCHNPAKNDGLGHQMMFRNAHTKSQQKKREGLGLKIDSISRNCLSCHDGSVGSSVMLRASDWRHSLNFIKYDNGGMHPIGMNYDKVRLKNKKSKLKPRSIVDKRISFFNHGCIGCASCHNPYSTNDKKLVIKAEGSALCFSCHNL